jgi:hypothetical protein
MELLKKNISFLLRLQKMANSVMAAAVILYREEKMKDLKKIQIIIIIIIIGLALCICMSPFT